MYVEIRALAAATVSIWFLQSTRSQNLLAFTQGVYLSLPSLLFKAWAKMQRISRSSSQTAKPLRCEINTAITHSISISVATWFHTKKSRNRLNVARATSVAIAACFHPITLKPGKRDQDDGLLVVHAHLRRLRQQLLGILDSCWLCLAKFFLEPCPMWPLDSNGPSNSLQNMSGACCTLPRR